MSRPASLGVAILTYNEEANIAYALDSVCGWADDVLVLDSGSEDCTAEIARRYECRFVVRAFESYGKQRNAALEALAGVVDWVLFLDADEYVPDGLKAEIDRTIAADAAVDGYYVKFRLIWQGHWIRWGYYPTWILRLVRSRKGICEERTVNEHITVEGRTARLQSDLIHEDRKGIGAWIDKHNRYASAEAAEATQFSGQEEGLRGKLFGRPPERTRWLRVRVWDRLPPIARSFAYFGYRYFLRGGFLDGRAGLTFHFLQALWYPLLIDLKYLEMKALPVAGRNAGDQVRLKRHGERQ